MSQLMRLHEHPTTHQPLVTLDSTPDMLKLRCTLAELAVLDPFIHIDIIPVRRIDKYLSENRCDALDFAEEMQGGTSGFRIGANTSVYE